MASVVFALRHRGLKHGTFWCIRHVPLLKYRNPPQRKSSRPVHRREQAIREWVRIGVPGYKPPSYRSYTTDGMADARDAQMIVIARGSMPWDQPGMDVLVGESGCGMAGRPNEATSCRQ